MEPTPDEDPEPEMFQSLLGFLMRCNLEARVGKGLYRVFQSLLGFLMRCNPYFRPIWRCPERFQSLLGFLMRCNPSQMYDTLFMVLVSIPIGFSNAL